MSLVNIKSQLDPLEEVWLGDCYPIEFFTDIDFKTKTILDKLILDTKESLFTIPRSLHKVPDTSVYQDNKCRTQIIRRGQKTRIRYSAPRDGN